MTDPFNTPTTPNPVPPATNQPQAQSPSEPEFDPKFLEALERVMREDDELLRRLAQ